MDNKDAYIEHLENTIKDLTNQVNNLTEMLLLIHMTYLQKEDWGKRPLAKLTCDILDDIQGIVYVRP